MRTGAHEPEGHYSLVHSHYWLSGQVGWLAADRWQVPLVHTMHTMARVKNQHLAEGDIPEPSGREIGEVQVVEAADRLIANTLGEAQRARSTCMPRSPTRWSSCLPAWTCRCSHRGTRARPVPRSGCRRTPRCCSSSAGSSRSRRPRCWSRRRPSCSVGTPSGAGELVVAVLGGPAGSGLAHPRGLEELARGPRHQRAGPVRAAGRRGPSWPTGTAPRTSSRCPRTRSRSGWSPSRRRRAAPRSWPPTWAACPPRSAMPACSSTGTTPTSGRWPSRRCWSTRSGEKP